MIRRCRRRERSARGAERGESDEIEQARKVIEIASVQNKYNVGDRLMKMWPEYCTKHGLAFIPWFPVAAGKLAKPGRPWMRRRRSMGLLFASFRWRGCCIGSPVMLPIPGTSSVEHLEDNIAAASVSSSDAEWERS